MKPTDFSVHLTNFLTHHLASQRCMHSFVMYNRKYRNGCFSANRYWQSLCNAMRVRMSVTSPRKLTVCHAGGVVFFCAATHALMLWRCWIGFAVRAGEAEELA